MNPLTIGIRNPSSTDKESGIHGLESRIVLDSLTWRDLALSGNQRPKLIENSLPFCFSNVSLVMWMTLQVPLKGWIDKQTTVN